MRRARLVVVDHRLPRGENFGGGKVNFLSGSTGIFVALGHLPLLEKVPIVRLSHTGREAVIPHQRMRKPSNGPFLQKSSMYTTKNSFTFSSFPFHLKSTILLSAQDVFIDGNIIEKRAMEQSPQSFDVCIVCALPEEARAFLAIVQQRCEDTLEERMSPRYQYSYRFATLKNDQDEPLNLLCRYNNILNFMKKYSCGQQASWETLGHIGYRWYCVYNLGSL